MSEHSYRGYAIERNPADGARWVIRTRHEATGMPYSHELCPKCNTLADCRADIDRRFELIAALRGD